ncbi:MAG TPA: M24 family metallopeptidase, partial [Burkholderiaceae bacterium]|nr:M24 family metallopeptidase [Burkholderiaceae bacterium]
EQPFMDIGGDTVLRAGEVVTVEPGLYIRGQGGLRIEDDALLLETGHEILSRAHRNFELPL